MNKEVSFQDYYGQFADATVKRAVADRFGIEKLKKAIKTDPYLNNIPLIQWDRMAEGFRSYLGPRISKANGGGVSLSDLVCTLKVAARLVIQESTEEEN